VKIYVVPLVYVLSLFGNICRLEINRLVILRLVCKLHNEHTVADIFAWLLDLNFKQSKLTRLNF